MTSSNIRTAKKKIIQPHMHGADELMNNFSTQRRCRNSNAHCMNGHAHGFAAVFTGTLA
ncbi:hypothetical protein [Ideonella azotifigens]|uniref:hypothetical protein n=1 Tax=Ideonella azotifigens TaxID=513160 RepID=UPI0031E4975B